MNEKDKEAQNISMDCNENTICLKHPNYVEQLEWIKVHINGWLLREFQLYSKTNHTNLVKISFVLQNMFEGLPWKLQHKLSWDWN